MIHGLTLTTLNDVKTAVQHAENQKKEPVYTVDIFRSVVKLGKFGSPSMIDIRRVLFDLYRADQILADEKLNKFSLDFINQHNPITPTGFDLCSERMQKKFAMYRLDEKCRIQPGPLAPRIDWQT